MSTDLSMWKKLFGDRDDRILFLVLIVGLVHGLIFVHLMPPWQHYDEPAHFEYAWMIANSETWPEWGQYDWDFRSDLVRSMIEHEFYRGAGLPVPDPDNLSGVIGGLQFPQIGDPPLYYLAASLPLRLLPGADLAVQLIAVRYVSLLLMLLTLVFAWLFVRELAPQESRLALYVPMTMALIPGFVDSMTACNNDAGSVLAGSFFLWAAARITQRGLSLRRFLVAALAVGAGVLTSKTAVFALPIFVILLIAAGLSKINAKLAWGLSIGVSILVTLGLFSNKEPAFWYRATTQESAIRVESSFAVDGSHAIALDPDAPRTPDWLQAVNQPLRVTEPDAFSGKTFTLGVWMWGAMDSGQAFGAAVRTPSIMAVSKGGAVNRYETKAFIQSEPSFVRFSFTLPADVDRLMISLTPNPEPAGRMLVYYDGFVLVEGDFIEAGLPELSSGGEWVDWGGVPEANLVRNPSAETPWLGFTPRVDNVLSRFMSDQTRPSLILQTLGDPAVNGPYYLGVMNNLHQTFWGRMGWGHVPLQFSGTVFSVLVLLVVAGLGGLPGKPLPGVSLHSYLLLGVSVLMIFAATLTRGTNNLFSSAYYYSSARYILPVIIPIVFMLVVGWRNWGMGLQRVLGFAPRATRLVYWSGFVLLDIFALVGIIMFYYP